MRRLGLMVLGALTLGIPAWAQQTVTLVGAGASFPFPLMAKYAEEYNRLTGGAVRVNYQSIGSGAGIRQFFEQTIHFAGSDLPLNDQQLKDVKTRFNTNALNIAYALGAIVPIYNLPGVRETLRFTGPVLSDIFLGKIKTWNDPSLQSLNPNVRLPATPITVVHRADSSGSTFILSDFLSKVSSEWASKMGRNTTLPWPTGIGARGNEGVAGVVRQTPGAIGYVEVTYAILNNLTYGAVQNKAGRFVRADLPSVKAAGFVPLPGDMRISLTHTDAPDGYPITSFTYLILYENLAANKAVKSEAEARALVEFIKWLLTEGQRFNEPLSYGALDVVPQKRALALLSRVTYGATPLGKEIVGR